MYFPGMKLKMCVGFQIFEKKRDVLKGLKRLESNWNKSQFGSLKTVVGGGLDSSPAHWCPRVLKHRDQVPPLFIGSYQCSLSAQLVAKSSQNERLGDLQIKSEEEGNRWEQSCQYKLYSSLSESCQWQIARVPYVFQQRTFI